MHPASSSFFYVFLKDKEVKKVAKKNEITYICQCCGEDLKETEYSKSASFLNQRTGRLPYCKRLLF